MKNVLYIGVIGKEYIYMCVCIYYTLFHTISLLYYLIEISLDFVLAACDSEVGIKMPVEIPTSHVGETVWILPPLLLIQLPASEHLGKSDDCSGSTWKTQIEFQLLPLACPSCCVHLGEIAEKWSIKVLLTFVCDDMGFWSYCKYI